MMKPAQRVVAVILIAAAAVAPAAADPLARIVAAVTRAAGGLPAARAIPALAYRLHIREAKFEVDASYYVDRRGRMRIDIYSGGRRVFTECHDGADAWQMDAGGTAQRASPAGRAALWHGTQLPGQILDLAELPAHGHRIASAGTETIDGVAYDVLELTLSDGFRTWRYVDRRTHRIVRGRDRRAPHPDVDAKQVDVETRWSDWRVVDGVLRPFVAEQRDLDSGRWLQTAVVSGIRSLPALPDGLFVFGSAPQDL